MLSRLLCISCLFTLITLTGCGRDGSSLPITGEGIEKKASNVADQPMPKASKRTSRERAVSSGQKVGHYSGAS